VIIRFHLPVRLTSHSLNLKTAAIPQTSFTFATETLTETYKANMRCWLLTHSEKDMKLVALG